MCVARLARAQIEVGSIVVGCAVDGNEQPVRSIVARAPYGNEGIAQDAIGGEAALDAAAFAVGACLADEIRKDRPTFERPERRRQEERRVGEGCVSTGRTGWSAQYYKKKK